LRSSFYFTSVTFLPIHLNTLPGVGHSVNTPRLLFIWRKVVSSLMINANSTIITTTAMTTIIVSLFTTVPKSYILSWQVIAPIWLMNQMIDWLSILCVSCWLLAMMNICYDSHIVLSKCLHLYSSCYFWDDHDWPQWLHCKEPMFFWHRHFYLCYLNHLLMFCIQPIFLFQTSCRAHHCFLWNSQLLLPFSLVFAEQQAGSICQLSSFYVLLLYMDLSEYIMMAILTDIEHVITDLCYYSVLLWPLWPIVSIP